MCHEICCLNCGDYRDATENDCLICCTSYPLSASPTTFTTIIPTSVSNSNPTYFPSIMPSQIESMITTYDPTVSPIEQK